MDHGEKPVKRQTRTLFDTIPVRLGVASGVWPVWGGRTVRTVVLDMDRAPALACERMRDRDVTIRLAVDTDGAYVAPGGQWPR